MRKKFFNLVGKWLLGESLECLDLKERLEKFRFSVAIMIDRVCSLERWVIVSFWDAGEGLGVSGDKPTAETVLGSGLHQALSGLGGTAGQ